MAIECIAYAYNIAIFSNSLDTVAKQINQPRCKRDPSDLLWENRVHNKYRHNA